MNIIMLKKEITSFLIATILTLTLLTLTGSTLAISPLQVIVETNKQSYQLRETVQIFGNVTYNGELVDQGLVGIQVKSPLGTLLTRTKLLGPPGTQDFKIEIELVTLCDQYGNPQQSIVRGRNAYFRMRIKNKDPLISVPVTATLTICSNDSIPLGILSRKTTIEPNGILDFWQNVYIAPWVKNGTATIYANVYSDWPENNGYPLCPEKAATFDILESEYEEPTETQPPQQTYQNGTYSANFTLSPEPIPGTYFVYATAWYLGWKTDYPAVTTFQVIDIEAPPRASFVIKPPIVGPGYEVKFDASPSTAEGYNDSITNYFWDFGDGYNATGKIAYHTYSTVGNYVVTLNVTDSEGFWNTTARTLKVLIIRNVGVMEISCLNEVYNNWLVEVSIKVKNLGTVSESFNVTLYANETFIAKKQVSLEPQSSTTLTITWNTTGLMYLQNYALKAIADTLINETETADNTLQYGPIFVRMMGDIRFDRIIDILDVVKVTSKYGKTQTDPEWDIMVDLNPDGKIDILDVVKVTARYGQSY